ncbi:MAG: hypothetical protein IJZ82_12765 [Lachnospiraceae bacterium]|nr:hypothetical protein [Lachnospiraceae bacterium]
MKKRSVVFAAIGGLGISFCLVAGKSLDINYTLDLLDKSFYLQWLFIALLLTVLLYIFWKIADGKLSLEKGKYTFLVRAAALVERVESRLRFPGIMLLLLLCWLPAWLSIFPGVFSYDAYDEWMQIYSGQLTAHHPVLHVLFLGGIVEGVYRLLGSYNLGIAICTFLQMAALAGALTYTIGFLRERGVNPLLRVFAFLFYGFSPVVQLFAICGTKDTLFTAAFLLFIISVYRLALQGEVFFENERWMAVFVLSSIFTMIMRNNGLYIVLCTLLVSVLACRKRWKKYLLLCVAVLAVYGLYIGPFYSVLGVTPGGKAEMLSVPLQQLARVYHYDKASFSDQELEYMYSIVPQENWELYRSTVSDYVKVGFQQEVFEQNPGKFFRFWLETGVKNPLSYINSFLIGSVDFWYPFSIIDGYQDVYGKSSYFDYKVSEPGTENVLLPAFHEVYEAISHEKEVQSIPGMFLILSPGWYLVLYLSLFLYQWKNKKYGQMLVLLPILINFGTVLLGPIALVRYVLILFFAFPMYCTMVGKAGGYEAETL